MEGDQVTQDGDQGNQNQDGNQSLGWRAGLPDDLKTSETFTPYKTVGEFAKAHIETTGKVKELEGKLATGIFKPDDKATPEQREAYYRALGKPEKATEYEIPKEEGVEHDPAMVEWAQNTFHAANLNKEQAQAIAKAWDGFITEMVKADEVAKVKAIADTETKLKTEWAGDYGKNVELANRAFKKFSDQELTAFLEETGVGNSPILTKVFASIGKAMGDDESLPGSFPKSEVSQGGMNYKTMDQFKGG